MITETIKSITLDEEGNAIMIKTVTTSVDTAYKVNFKDGTVEPIGENNGDNN